MNLLCYVQDGRDNMCVETEHMDERSISFVIIIWPMNLYIKVWKPVQVWENCQTFGIIKRGKSF